MFYCTQCYRSSFSALTSQCLYCGYSEPKTTVSDNFNPTEPEALSQFGTASGSKSKLLPNNMQMDELARTLDRTRNISKHRIELDNSSSNKRSRNDICATTSQALPTRNEQVAIDYDMAKETRPASQIAFEKSALDSIHNKFPSNKELHLHYQDMLECGNLEKYMLQNSASNFDNFQIPQNLNVQKEISDSVAPMREMIPYVDERCAVPGPSGFHKNENTSSLWVKELKPISSLEQQSSGVTEKNGNEKRCNLQQHTDIIHSDEMRCNICEELIFDKKDHGNEETCKFCGEKFLCKTLLEQHSLDHESDYTSNCMVCLKTFSEHVDPKDETYYKCCRCPLRNRLRCDLRSHLYLHTGLKLFKCDLCDMRFTQKPGLYHHMHKHFRCEVCGKTFLRSQQLNSHRSEKHQI